MKARRIAIALALATAFAVGQVSALTRSGKVEMPDFTRVLGADAAVTEISMSFDCVSVASVEGVPDGWSFSAIPSGERYTVRIAREDAEAWLRTLGIPERDANNRKLQRIRIGLAFRGQWSDCAGARLTVQGVRGTSGATSSRFVRMFRSVDFFRSWESDDDEAAPKP